MDATSLVLLGVGAYAIVQAAKSASGAAGDTGQPVAPIVPVSTSEANRVLQQSNLPPIQARPGDRVAVTTEQTPAGQTIQYVLHNYSPAAPGPGQVLISPEDQARQRGFWVPQIDKSSLLPIARQFGHIDVDRWLSEAAVGRAGVPDDFQLHVYDWEYFANGATGWYPSLSDLSEEFARTNGFPWPRMTNNQYRRLKELRSVPVVPGVPVITPFGINYNGFQGLGRYWPRWRSVWFT